jgi:hypothetical protein
MLASVATLPTIAGLQINPVMAQAGVQASGCECWQAEACAPERVPNYFVNVQKSALRNADFSRRQVRLKEQ